MPSLPVKEIRQLMGMPQRIRNMSVIAHVDHGKSTLTDSLIGKAGLIAEARQGEARFMDTRDDEQARSITIKSTCVSLLYEREEEKSDDKCSYLINLIDSPGHVDFSSEVTAALRVTDGALVVVDCVEGVCVQTETVLRQAISERIIPVLFMNKLDRAFLELNADEEEIYATFRKNIEDVNVCIATYQEEDLLGDLCVHPENGQVGFGSGLHAWGFTLRDFAQIYSSKFGMSTEKLMKKLWGDNFWNEKTKEWCKKSAAAGKKECERGFCKFILKPIKLMINSLMAQQKEIYLPAIEALRIVIPSKERDLIGKQLMKCVMRNWLPAGNALLDMIVEKLPSPIQSQKYRADILYTGPQDSKEFAAIQGCNQQSDIMTMYISKMVPTSEKGRFYAFGRVFSGKIKTGQTVRIMGPDFEYGTKTDLYVKKIQRTVLMMGKYVEQLVDCPAGNMCGLVGVDQYILKSGSISSSETAHPFVQMKFSVSAVVQVAVSTKNAKDLPKLVDGLKKLSKSDPLVKISTSKTGEHIIAGAGELHLEICLKDLRDQYMKGSGVTVSEPIVPYAETISAVSSMQVVSKSPNKHNRLYVESEPLGDPLVKAIKKGEVFQTQDYKVRAKLLAEEYGWNVNDGRKIWAFGCPPDALGNLLVEQTKGVQYLHEIKDHVKTGFIQFTNGGVLVDEVCRGYRCNIKDVVLHADTIHRGAGQLMPCCRKVFSATTLVSEPRLCEPLYLVDITVPQLALSGVYNTLNTRRGTVEKMEPRIGTPLTQIQAFLPVAESFGFTALLRKNTGGQAFPQMRFSHWQNVTGNPLKEGSSGYEIMMAIRQRKGMKIAIPQFGDYYDKV